MEVTIVALDVGTGGGMERQLAELVTGLLDARDRVTVIARRCALEPRPGLRFIRVPGPARPFSLAFPWFFAAASMLAAQQRRGLLHTTGALVANRADVSTVHLSHKAISSTGVVRASRQHRMYRFNARLAALLARTAERFCYRASRTRRLVAVSDGLGRELAAWFPRMADRIEVIVNGIDHQGLDDDPTARRSLRSQWGLNESDFVALFVGSEWEGKGLRSCIEGVAQTPGCHLLVVGSGDTARFRAHARAARAEDRVHFVGRVNTATPYYRAADVFVLPTVYESFSLVTHEAAAAGLPLVVGRVSGVEDILVEGRNGWFVEQVGAQVALRLTQLRDDGDRRRAMGAASRSAVAGLDWTSMVAAYRNLYSRLDRENSATTTAHAEAG
jgi:UDP-glucose:(heptosyl)LPS alpha-1,3-glucosyltransferase